VNEGWQGHSNLRILKSVDNKFKSLTVFKAMPLLTEFYLASNQIASLQGWD